MSFGRWGRSREHFNVSDVVPSRRADWLFGRDLGWHYLVGEKMSDRHQKGSGYVKMDKIDLHPVEMEAA